MSARLGVTETVIRCRTCQSDALALLDDGTGEIPPNPLAGECARCGADGDLYAGCCRECYDAGWREQCDLCGTGFGCAPR